MKYLLLQASKQASASSFAIHGRRNLVVNILKYLHDGLFQERCNYIESGIYRHTKVMNMQPIRHLLFIYVDRDMTCQLPSVDYSLSKCLLDVFQSGTINDLTNCSRFVLNSYMSEKVSIFFSNYMALIRSAPVYIVLSLAFRRQLRHRQFHRLTPPLLKSLEWREVASEHGWS